MIEIDLQDANGGPTSRRYAHQHRAVPSEVPRPFMTARIEQRHDSSGIGIDASDIRTFMAVAREAAYAKIAGFCRPLMIFRNDVIDLEGEPVV